MRDTPFVLVLGGSGFIGRHLVARLGVDGCRIIVPTRRFEHARDLLVVPGVEDVVEADVHDDAALNRLVEGKDAVINLVGVLHSRPASDNQKYGPDFARAHVELPRRVVAACAAHGVRRYLHMSALGADPNGPSMYLRSKGDGEAAARSNFAVTTTVFRPSVVFGEDDHFLNLFARMQKHFPVIPLACADAKFQPVYVHDVVHAFAASLNNIRTFGKTYPLVGPRVYTLRELVRLAGEYSGHPRPIVELPPMPARMQAWMFEHLPGEPLMSRDNLDSMRLDSVSDQPMASELGIMPTALEMSAPNWLCK
jgi:NADH dehydrogenase